MGKVVSLVQRLTAPKENTGTLGLALHTSHDIIGIAPHSSRPQQQGHQSWRPSIQATLLEFCKLI